MHVQIFNRVRRDNVNMQLFIHALLVLWLIDNRQHLTAKVFRTTRVIGRVGRLCALRSEYARSKTSAGDTCNGAHLEQPRATVDEEG